MVVGGDVDATKELYIGEAIVQLQGRRVLPSSPTFGAGRQTGLE